MNRVAELYEQRGDLAPLRHALADALVDLGGRGQRAAALLRAPRSS
jgi:hypothetical protein